MGNIFNTDFREFIQALNDSNVEYILVGGYSVILHGHNRTTGDMDIWVNRTKQNYDRIVTAFAKFGMPLFDMTLPDFLNPAKFDVFRFGRKPMGIDIMTRVKGLEFEQCLKHSKLFKLEGIEIRTLDLQDLIKSKTEAGRYKDLDDISMIKKTNPDNETK